MNNLLIKIIKRVPFIKNRIKSIKGVNINEMIINRIDSKKPVIVDVGANTGQTIDNYLELFDNPMIYSFEPTSHLFRELENKYKANSKVNLINFALSDSNGEAEFFESDYSPTNSLLKPNVELYQKIEEEKVVPSFPTLSKTFKETLKSVIVKTVRFDDWYMNNIKDEKISIFKSDTQGFDFEVLNGAKQSLHNIKFIIVECQFQEFYKASKPFFKIFEFLYNNGFYLYNFVKNNNKTQIFECGAIFVNSVNFDNA